MALRFVALTAEVLQQKELKYMFCLYLKITLPLVTNVTHPSLFLAKSNGALLAVLQSLVNVLRKITNSSTMLSYTIAILLD